jgi:hypothetical protein
MAEQSEGERPARCAKRWFEAADFRHATEGPPVRPDSVVYTLCGDSTFAVTPPPGRYPPQCPACDRIWRDIEHIPHFDGVAQATGTRTFS